MLKLLPKAVLLSLLIGMPAMAQTLTWERFRDGFLGEGRSYLMSVCATGKKWNQIDKSFWDQALIERVKEELRKQSLSTANFDAMHAGLTTAMAVACPTVW